MVATGLYADQRHLDGSVTRGHDRKHLSRLALSILHEMRNCPLYGIEGCLGQMKFPLRLVEQLKNDGLPTRDVYAALSKISRTVATCRQQNPTQQCRVRPMIEILAVNIGLRSHEDADAA
jgi:hypothetical protein